MTQLINLFRFACITALLALTGCATDYKPDVNLSSAAPKTEQTDIRQLFLETNSLLGNSDFWDIKSISLANEGLYVHHRQSHSDKEAIIKWDDLDPKTDGSWWLDLVIPLGHCSVILTNGKSTSYTTTTPGGFNTGCGENEKKFINMLVLLKQAVKDDEQRFEQALSFYRSSKPKPEANEEIHRWQILAVNAVHSKDNDAAEKYFAQGTIAAAWWPAFHYNRALILAELHEYFLAAMEMKRYIALVPDAGDVRAAQDKIYIWETEFTKQ